MLAGEVPDAPPTTQVGADILDVTKDNGPGEDRPGTPLSFLYTKDLDDESVKARRIESANADLVELALKGKTIKPVRPSEYAALCLQQLAFWRAACMHESCAAQQWSRVYPNRGKPTRILPGFWSSVLFWPGAKMPETADHGFWHARR